MDNVPRAAMFMNSGPIYGNVLTLQNKHRCQNIWLGQDVPELSHQKGGVGDLLDNIDPRIYEKTVDCGFEGVVKVGTMIVNYALVTALVERWRNETYTFHFPVGEATITLQDVEVLTGLCVDGAAVTGCTKLTTTCERLLGVLPIGSDVSGNSIKLSWFVKKFGKLPTSANDLTVHRYTRAFIMRHFGGLLFSNENGNKVHVMWPLTATAVGKYAWEAAVFANLYRELNKATDPEKDQMCGYVQILQLWAFERLKNISPGLSSEYRPGGHEPYAMKWKRVAARMDGVGHGLKELRRRLDQMRSDEFVWMPYISILHLLLPYCRQGNGVWRAVVPIICFHIVEFHHPDRCLRQFGMDQPIPAPIPTH